MHARLLDLDKILPTVQVFSYHLPCLKFVETGNFIFYNIYH